MGKRKKLEHKGRRKEERKRKRGRKGTMGEHGEREQRRGKQSGCAGPRLNRGKQRKKAWCLVASHAPQPRLITIANFAPEQEEYTHTYTHTHTHTESTQKFFRCEADIQKKKSLLRLLSSRGGWQNDDGAHAVV